MDDARFQDLVDRFGEDLRLWPDADRAAAEELLGRSASARAALAAAIALRQSFDAEPTIKAPAGLVARIVAKIEEVEAPEPSDDRPVSLRAR